MAKPLLAEFLRALRDPNERDWKRFVYPLELDDIEAKGVGWNLQSGWKVRFTGVNPLGDPEWEMVNPQGRGLKSWQTQTLEGQPTREAIPMLAEPGIQITEPTPEELIGNLFPEFNVDDLLSLGQRNVPAFLDFVVAKGRTPDTEALLRGLGATDDEINQIFPSAKEGSIFGERGTRAGLANAGIRERGESGTREILLRGGVKPEEVEKILAPPKPGAPKPPQKAEGFWKDVGQALYTGTQSAIFKAGKFATSIVPEVMFPDYEWATPEKRLANQELRNRFRRISANAQNQFDVWVEKHPELETPEQFRGDPFKNPALLKDPKYLVYTFAEMLPFTLAALGTGALATIATGGFVPAGILAAFATVAPMQNQDVYDEMLAEGAPEGGDTALIAMGAGTLIAALDSVGNLPLLGAIKAPSKALTTNIRRSLLRQVVENLVKRGGKVAGQELVAETLTEDTQLVIQNAVVGAYDKSRGLFDGIGETTIKTLIATGPFAIFGGAISMRRVSPERAASVAEPQRVKEGWQQDPISGQWFEPKPLVESVKEDIKTFRDTGLTEEQATTKAFNEAAKTPEGEKAISETVGKIDRGEQIAPAPEAKPVPAKAEMPQPAGVKEGVPEVKPTVQSVVTKIIKQEELTLEEEQFRKNNLNKVEALLKWTKEYAPEGFVSTKVKTAKPELPTPVPGAPEAGVQEGMFGEAKVFQPKGKGKVTQISMEDQLKLEQARKAAEPTPEQQAAYEARVTAEALKELHGVDPVASARFTMGKRQVGLDAFISIREQSFPEYFNVNQAKALFPGHDFSSFISQKYPQGHVPKDVALDDLTKRFNMTPDEIANRVMQIRKEKAQIREAERFVPEPIGVTPAEVSPAIPPIEPPAQAIIAPEPTPEVPTGGEITRIIDQSKEQVRQSAPAALKRAGLHIPGLKQMLQFERPGFKMTGENQKVAIAIIAENAARSDIATMSVGTRIPALNELRKVFGLDVLHGAKSDIKFIGTPEQAKSPLTGTLLDIVQNPELYELNQRQLGAIAFIQTHTDRMLDWVKTEYNAEIGRWVPKENGAYLPNVDAPEDVVEYLGSEMRAVISGRGKTRVWATARERLAGKTPFKPQLDVQKLIEGIDDYKSAVAGAQVYRAALGGLTRLEAMKETHPQLYEKMMALRGRLQKLQGYKNVLREQELKAIDEFLTSAGEDIDIGNLRDALELQAGRFVAKAQAGKTLTDIQTEINEVRGELQALRPMWKVANLKPYVLIQEGLWRYFPMEQAALIKESRLISRSPVLFFIENVRGGAFSGDLSPFTIQGLLGLLMNPLGVLKASVGAAKAAIQHHDLLRSVRVSALADDIGNNPVEFGRYASLMGRTLTGTPNEYAAGFLSKIPGIGKFIGKATETSYVIVTRGSFDLWKQEYKHLMKTGVPEVEAQVAAIEMANKVYPLVNPKLLGQSEARTALLRALPTSYSFIRQPAALIEQATQGFAKLMIGKKTTPQEGMAMRFIVTGATSVMVVSATSAALSAIDRGEDEDDVRKAIWDAINPDPMNGKFASIIIGDKSIPLGGPYRAIFRALYPQEVKGIPFPVPLAGLFSFRGYLYNRLTPAIRTQIDLFARNKEYAGTQIRTGKPIEGLLKAIWYEFEQALPLTAGELSEALRRGERYTENIWQQVISQFMGVNMVTLDNTYLDRQGRQLGLEIPGEAKPFSIQKPNIYQTNDLWGDTIRVIKDRTLHDLEVREDNPKTLAIARARDIKREVDALRNIKATTINPDASKGDTYIELNEQWLERQKIKGEEDLAEFDKKYPNAELGNIGQRELVLLREYHSITDKKKQAEFLKAHPELTAIPRQDWLKSHPKENAQLAVWGQVDILTKEAYTEFKKLVKDLDIPDSALPERTLPPEGSIDTHFKYLDMVAEGTHGSWGADLMLAKDPEYLKWKGLKPTDTPIAALELKVKNRTYLDTLASYGKQDSPDYIADEKARAVAVAKLRADNPSAVDDMRRIEAIEKGTDKLPVDQKVVDAHVTYGKLQDAPGVGSSSAEVMLYRVDNPEYDTWRQDANVWGNSALKPIDQSRIPIWRIDVKYHNEDTEYEAIKATLPAEQARLKDEYMAKHPEYRKDSRRREAYQKGLSGQVENYVAYYELPVSGYRQERFLFNNPNFASALGLKVPDRVPAEQYDILLEKPEKTPDDLLRMDAYKLYVPEKFVNDYAGYYRLVKPTNYEVLNKTALWFEDDWFMYEHPQFYRDVYIGLLKKQPINFTKLPTRQVFAKYLNYVQLVTNSQQRQYRWDNEDLDAWGSIRFGWTPINRQPNPETAGQRAQREFREGMTELRRNR